MRTAASPTTKRKGRWFPAARLRAIRSGNYGMVAQGRQKRISIPGSGRVENPRNPDLQLPAD